MSSIVRSTSTASRNRRPRSSGDSYHGRLRSSDQLQQPQEIGDLAPAAIAITDESDRQINFNSLKKSIASLPAAIAIMDESNRQINCNSLKKFATSLSAVIGALDSSLGPHPESDIETDLYYGSTPIAIKMSPITGWLYPSSQL
jgi:hypothetical protein